MLKESSTGLPKESKECAEAHKIQKVLMARLPKGLNVLVNPQISHDGKSFLSHFEVTISDSKGNAISPHSKERIRTLMLNSVELRRKILEKVPECGWNEIRIRTLKRTSGVIQEYSWLIEPKKPKRNSAH